MCWISRIAHISDFYYRGMPHLFFIQIAKLENSNDKSLLFPKKLLLDVDALDAVADRGKNFVGDGVESFAEDGDGQFVAEDDGLVAFLTVDACDINHTHVHADVADIRRFLTVDQTVAMTVAQVTVEPVCIAYGDGGDTAVALHKTLAALTD